MNRRRKFSIAGIIILSAALITLTFKIISEVAVAYTGPSCACDCNNCDSRCWQCAMIKDNNFIMRQLPYTYSEPSDSCKDSMDGVTIDQLPFKVDGEWYCQIPVTVRHEYCVYRWCPGPSKSCDYEITFW